MPAPDSEHLLTLLQQFIQAPTWVDSRRVVEIHPELLTDDADALITQLAATQNNDSARQIVLDYHTLLCHCRDVGIEAAFAEKVSSSSPAAPTKLRSILKALDRPARLCDIPRHVQLCQQALSLIEHASQPKLWAALQNKLANSLAQTPMGDRAENIERAIHHYTLALEVRTRQAFLADWAMTQNNLANAYYSRIRGDRAENIERAIQHYSQALEVRTRQATPADWAMTQNNLANAYSDRIRGDQAENIERAILHYSQALEVYTRQADPKRWAGIQNNLATAYRNRIRGDRAENIERAIHYYTQALEVRTRQTDPERWAMTQNNLATTYLNRIRGERAKNIEFAIHHYMLTLEVRTRHALPAGWAMTQDNLASAYSERIRGDRAENIERAIHHYTQALEIRTRQADPRRWAATQSNLGEAYRNRIRGDRAENIERAIHHYSQTLEVRTRQAFPTNWAMTQNNMALAYVDRIRGDRAENIERAIHHYSLALEVYTRQTDSERWASIQNNLANAYRNHIRGDQAENIECAIHHYTLTLEIYTHQANPERWAATQNNLANAYSERIWGDRAENIECAVHHYSLALEVYNRQTFPVDWAMIQNNLGRAYSDRTQGDRGENVERAIHHYLLALKVRTRYADADEHRRTQRNLANLCFEENRWSEAIIAYQGALSAADLLYQAAATPEARRAELREIRDLSPRLALALSKIVEGADDAPLQDAALALEQNRARWLSEILALHSQKPPDVPENVWQTFVTHRERIQQLQVDARLPEDTPGKRGYLTLSEELAAAYTTLDETVTHIREYDDTFMPVPTFDQIQAVVEADCPLIYFAVSPVGTVALVVTPTAVHLIHGPLTEDELGERIQGPAAAPELGYLGAYVHDPVWLPVLDETTHWLWDTLMGPVVESLIDLGIDRAILVPQGNLGLLPLHAAWTKANGKRRYAMDDVCFTYAPNARALSAARATAARVPPDRIFAIDEPQPVSADPLLNSNAEVSAACEHFSQRKVLGGNSATAQAVRDQLIHHTVLHFSCHGLAGFDHPLDGGIRMAHDEILTLRDILTLRLENARLAVLSTCETGIPGTELPDEVISLPTGLAQAGIAGVVASLWFVSDLSTMMLMAQFYKLWKRDGLEPPAALRQSQLWMRDATNGQKVEYFKDFLPEFKPEPRTGLPIHIADTLYKASILSPPDENDFSHPFYWAAFTYTGV